MCTVHVFIYPMRLKHISILFLKKQNVDLANIVLKSIENGDILSERSTAGGFINAVKCMELDPKIYYVTLTILPLTF